jgi:hypothetical protein
MVGGTSVGGRVCHTRRPILRSLKRYVDAWYRHRRLVYNRLPNAEANADARASVEAVVEVAVILQALETKEQARGG